MKAQIVEWLDDALHPRRPPDVVIGDGAVYLNRWHLIPRNPLLNIYLHEFCRSDDDRALHDHPWASVSIILRGYYAEHRILQGGVNTRRRFGPGAVIFRGARYAHRIEIAPGARCWTLFITGPRIRQWGFHCPQGWRHWREFADGPQGERIGRGCE